jgi:hypothetical protein
MQNVKAYQGLLDTHYDEANEIDEFTKRQHKDFMKQVIGDAEKLRVPWQVGREGEFGGDIEPLDEAFLHEIMTGEKASISTLNIQATSGTQLVTQPKGMMQFSSSSIQNSLRRWRMC